MEAVNALRRLRRSFLTLDNDVPVVIQLAEKKTNEIKK